MEDLIREVQSFSLKREEVEELFRDETILGIGKNRIVILFEGSARKIAWKESGLQDNEIEYLLYQKSSDSLRPLLCPTKKLYSDGSSIQSLCYPIPFSDLSKEGHSLVSRLSRFGISDSAVNIGRLENRLVCYDYNLLSPSLLGKVLQNSFPE